MRLYIFLVFLIIFRLSSKAQSISNAVKIIDSLVYFNQFDEVEKKIDILSKRLNRQIPYNKRIELQLLYYKAHINAVRLKNNTALEIAVNIIKQSREYKLPEWEFKAHLLAAGLYEQSSELLKTCKENLDQAYQIYKFNKLDHLYSIYCVRMSSYYRFTGKKDSAIFYASQGSKYAKKYDNNREKRDANLLLGILYRNTDLEKSIHFSSLAAKNFLHHKDKSGAAHQYLNISFNTFEARQFDKSVLYADSAYLLIKTLTDTNTLLRYFNIKQILFQATKQFDSAYHYLNEYHKIYISNQKNLEQIDIRKLSIKYENEKKDGLIKSKNQQFNFIVGLLGFVALATVALIRKNHKIKTQNIIINKQLNELHESLEVKKVLLSELQHRVKNNLQNIISILEIQKESIDFNNVDELIRANQNRINSMVLLQQKLDISQNIDLIKLKEDIDHFRLKDYVHELVILVRDSYLYINKNITLDIDCKIEELSIQKAQPLGMIIVELVSNSIKHAFKDQKSGTIRIIIQRNLNDTANEMHYTDNGIGFDPNTSSKKKGLGLEIIYGLTDQLNGKMSIDHLHQKGFGITISF